MANNSSDARAVHWTKTRNLTFIVLALWFLFSVIIPFNAGSLNASSFLGFPLGYWFCVQGSLLAFLALIVFQNFRQDAIDDEAGVGEE